MKTKRQSDWKGFRAIFWRAMVFLPWMAAVFLAVTIVAVSILVLPISVVLLVYAQEWWQAAGVFALWLLALWIWQRFRVRRFLEEPPSLL